MIVVFAGHTDRMAIAAQSMALRVAYPVQSLPVSARWGEGQASRKT